MVVMLVSSDGDEAHENDDDGDDDCLDNDNDRHIYGLFVCSSTPHQRQTL